MIMKNIRLEKIADMVQEGMIVADIGTDHALLPILLIESGKTSKVYACDITKGPLSSAIENIKKYNLSTKIIPILSDGFENVPDDTQVAVIAGMGYLTAAGILERSMNKISSYKQIITEINRDPHEMRKWISDHHFTILDEAYVNDRAHDYVIISFCTSQHDCYSEEEIMLGPDLMHTGDSSYIQYCSNMFQKLDEIIKKSNGQAPNIENIVKRRNIYKEYLDRI